MPKRLPTVLEMHRKALEAAGFEVRRKAEWIKHSFEVDRAQRDELKRVASERNMLLKDALYEAIAAWLEGHRDPRL